MSYMVYLKDEEGNQISDILGISAKRLGVDQLEYIAGSLKIGPYYLPISNILFVQEV